MSSMTMNITKAVKNGTYDARITGVNIKSDKNENDYATLVFELKPTGEVRANVFSNFNEDDIFPSKICEFLMGDAYQSEIEEDLEVEIDFEDLFDESCTITIERDGKFTNVLDIVFHQQFNEKNDEDEETKQAGAN